MRSALFGGPSFGTSDPVLRQAFAIDDAVAVKARLAEIPKSAIRPNVVDVLAYSHTRKSLDAILSAGWDPSGGRHQNGPLFGAIERGDLPVVKVLLDHGVSPNSISKSGMPALIEAVAFGGTTGSNLREDLPEPPVAKYLLEHGANLDAEGFLASGPAGSHYLVRPLTRAILSGNAGSVKLLLEHGDDPNWNPRGQAPPIVLATENGSASMMIKMLLDHGAKVDLPGTLVRYLSPGRRESVTATSLYFAAENGDSETSRLLLSRGANPNAKARNGRTPVEAARGDAIAILRKAAESESKHG